ncbi:MAG: hypothetical protein EXQ94_06225 [Alphaproteobacteria bacterium]|nr:hypothetical protein [Alphaproteobacteria bacterium]
MRAPALAVALVLAACSGPTLPPRFASEANDAILALANGGDLDAQVALGQALEGGRGGAPDYAAAAQWYRRAADQGHTLAQYQLGQLYEHGRGVAQDYAEAARWYRAAAEGGSDVAGFQLGYLYEKGLGVPRDVAQAIAWYDRAVAGWRAKNSYPLAPDYVLVGITLPAAAAIAAPVAVPAEPAPLSGTYVHLASFRSAPEAATAWDSLRAHYPDLLQAFDATLAELDLGEGSGLFYQVLAGPLADAGAAEDLCAALNGRGQFCNPVTR